MVSLQPGSLTLLLQSALRGLACSNLHNPPIRLGPEQLIEWYTLVEVEEGEKGAGK